MKVHLIKKLSIEEYVQRNAQSRASFESWLSVLKWANWKDPKDIVSTFNSADIIGRSSKRVVFNIGGNNCKYHFGRSKIHLFIKWIGTHAEYTKLCNEGKQYEIDVY